MIIEDENGGTASLTTDSCLSRYGIPILRVEAEDINGEYGPGDVLNVDDTRGILTAAQIVAGWALNPERTKEEIKAAQAFLRQWPEGPQVE